MKIHYLSHYGNDVTKNNKPFPIAMCGIRGYSTVHTGSIEFVNCKKCLSIQGVKAIKQDSLKELK